MAILDWSQCPAVESIPGKRGGAWVFRNSRMPVATVFENLEDGMTVDEVAEMFSVEPDQIKAVLEFAARSLDPSSGAALIEAMQASPYKEIELEPEQSRLPVREVAL